MIKGGSFLIECSGFSEEVTFEKRPEWIERKWCEDMRKEKSKQREQGRVKDAKGNKL